MRRLMKVGVYWLVCLPDSGGTGLDACLIVGGTGLDACLEVGSTGLDACLKVGAYWLGCLRKV